MALYTYSAPLLTSAGSSPAPRYTVPLGYVAVVRDISGVVLASMAAAVQFNSSLDGVTTAAFFYVADTFTLGQMFHWEGRVVIPPGGFVEANPSTVFGAVQFAVSGYLLYSSL